MYSFFVLINTIFQRIIGIRKRIKIKRTAKIGKRVFFEGDNYVGCKTSLFDCKIGRMTYVANNCCFSKTYIGRYTSIGSNVNIITGEHPTRDFVSTCPAFFDRSHSAIRCFVNNNKFMEYKYTDDTKKWHVEIGNDVWIASNSQILEGCRIGDGAIIAAGAVVVKDVLPYSIVGGVPAKVIRYRFSQNEINWLEKLQWWNKDEDWILRHAEYYDRFDRFKDIVEKEQNEE